MIKLDILIPVFIDNDDRLVNLYNTVNLLKKYDFIKIYIGEYYIDNPRVQINDGNVKVVTTTINSDFFNKMSCVNELFDISTSQYVAVYDADVLIFKKSLINALNMLDNGYDLVYPYNGYFYNLPKPITHKLLNTENFCLSECILWNKNSYGGCVIFNRNVFLSGGKCNPNFKNVGYDDNEIFERFSKLGYVIGRTDYPILHMEHDRSHTAFGSNKYELHNATECSRIFKMNKQQLIEEIKTW